MALQNNTFACKSPSYILVNIVILHDLTIPPTLGVDTGAEKATQGTLIMTKTDSKSGA